MKLICFEPELSNIYEDRWGQEYEGKWKVKGFHCGYIYEDYYRDLMVFQQLFRTFWTSGPLKEELNKYQVSVVNIYASKCTERELKYLSFYYKSDIEQWKEFQKRGRFFNTVEEFCVKAPFKDKYKRCAVILGKQTMYPLTLKMVLKFIKLKLIALYRNNYERTKR